MVSWNDIHKGFEEPMLALRGMNKLFYSRLGRYDHNPRGTNFFELDWDNLIILDACRYDTFRKKIEEYDIPGHLRAEQSLGSATYEFLQANLDGQDRSDVVYVTATSMLYRETALRSNLTPRFHDTVDVWRDNVEYGKGGVPPRAVTEAAVDAHGGYPSKRLAIHYLQPHTPFIGTFGQEMFSDGEHAIWTDKLTGNCDVPDNDINRAYRENLGVVLEQVETLVEKLPGKTIITSDHGQAISDRAFPIPYPEYGHPSGMYMDVLTEVPYFICDHDNRRKVRDGNAGENYRRRNSEIDKKVTEQLKGLGYV